MEQRADLNGNEAWDEQSTEVTFWAFIKAPSKFCISIRFVLLLFQSKSNSLNLTNITIYFGLILSCKYAVRFFEKCTRNFDLKRRISNNNRSLHKVFKPIIEKNKLSIKATQFIHVLIKHIHSVFQICLLNLKTVFGL